MAVNLPVNPSPAQATVGKDYLLYINTGTPTIPVWTLIGGQRTSTLTRKGEIIDASDKTTGGWKASLVGLLSWSITLDGLVLLQDAGLTALETAFNAAQQVNLQFVYPDGAYRTGWGSITELTIDNQYNQAAVLKGNIDGVGPLSGLLPSVTPLAVTVSKSAATDQTFTVAPATENVASVMNGAVALTATSQYTYSTGNLVIKGTYLSTLNPGTETLTINNTDGTSFTITVTITA